MSNLVVNSDSSFSFDKAYLVSVPNEEHKQRRQMYSTPNYVYPGFMNIQVSLFFHFVYIFLRSI